MNEFRIKKFWVNIYENKTAIVELPKPEALKFVNKANIRIGLTRALISIYVEKIRCFKCLEYGHIARRCPGQDNSKKCYNCGREGHKAKDCKEEATCVVCQNKGRKNIIDTVLVQGTALRGK